MRNWNQSPDSNEAHRYEEPLPIFRISIRTAAKLIAEGLSEWNGEEFDDSDYIQFQRLDEASGYRYIGAHEFVHVEPTGRIKAACEAIEIAIVNAVDRGHIVPKQTRRNLAGEVQPAYTHLDVDDILNWCESVDIEPSEMFLEYREQEKGVEASAYICVEKERFDLENEGAFGDAKMRGALLTQDEITNVIIENLRFRQGFFEAEDAPNEKGLQQRERHTLLTIIAVLCKEAGLEHTKHSKTAGILASTAASMGLSIGDSTIESHLKKITNALAGRMK